MDSIKWIIELLLTLGIFYIGVQQTKKYREDDKKDKIDNEHRQEMKSSLEQFKTDVFFMFDNHGHEIICSNESCTKQRTGKVFITPPQQNRG